MFELGQREIFFKVREFEARLVNRLFDSLHYSILCGIPIFGSKTPRFTFYGKLFFGNMTATKKV